MKDSRSLLRLAGLIDAELDSLGRLEAEREEILKRAGESGATLIEIRALGLLLHDLYSRAERIFERVSQAFDGGVPEGANWHQDLLTSMSFELPTSRPPLITPDTAETLQEFLRFRHVLRHNYGHRLDWDRLVALAGDVPLVLYRLKQEVGLFSQWLRKLAEDQDG